MAWNDNRVYAHGVEGVGVSLVVQVVDVDPVVAVQVDLDVEGVWSGALGFAHVGAEDLV